MDDNERRIEHATAEIAALRAIVIALIASAPDRTRLQVAMEREKETTTAILLGQRASDEWIALIQRLIDGFLQVEPQAP